MNDRTIMNGLSAAKRDVQSLQAQVDELGLTLRNLIALSSRRAHEDDCFRRARFAIEEARYASWEALPRWRRALTRPPTRPVSLDEIRDLAVKIRTEEIREERVRQAAAAAAAQDAGDHGQPEAAVG